MIYSYKKPDILLFFTVPFPFFDYYKLKLTK